MAWSVWVLLGFLLLGVEMMSATAHVGFFAVGAFVVAILEGVGVDLPLWGQLLVFTGTSLLAFAFVRPVLVKRLKLDRTPVVDSLVGEQAIVIGDISVGGDGRAELRGSTWNARNVGETALISGQRCIVANVEGLVLHLRAS